MSRTINVAEIPKGGPYSHAVVSGNLAFLSGQVGTLPNMTQNFDEQFENAMGKIKKILEAGGFTLENVVKTSVYLSNKQDFKKLNDLYSKFFQTTPPARTTVVAGFASDDVLVEIEVIASK